jgi:hypothetical protein
MLCTYYLTFTRSGGQLVRKNIRRRRVLAAAYECSAPFRCRRPAANDLRALFGGESRRGSTRPAASRLPDPSTAAARRPHFYRYSTFATACKVPTFFSYRRLESSTTYFLTSLRLESDRAISNAFRRYASTIMSR